jgi:hypothetical protein
MAKALADSAVWFCKCHGSVAHSCAALWLAEGAATHLPLSPPALHSCGPLRSIGYHIWLQQTLAKGRVWPLASGVAMGSGPGPAAVATCRGQQTWPPCSSSSPNPLPSQPMLACMAAQHQQVACTASRWGTHPPALTTSGHHPALHSHTTTSSCTPCSPGVCDCGTGLPDPPLLPPAALALLALPCLACCCLGIGHLLADTTQVFHRAGGHQRHLKGVWWHLSDSSGKQEYRCAP